MNNQQTTNAILDLADKMEPAKDKELHMKEYITSIKAIEDAMEPYKEQKRELKSEYIENGWLNKEDISLTVKAYRLLKDEVDISALIDVYESLKGAK